MHIGTETVWRGGENQVFLLANGLKQYSVANHFAYPEGSEALNRMRLGPVLPMQNSLPLDPRPLNQLEAFVREHQIQLIHAHSSGAHSFGLKLKKRLPHVKLIVHRRVAFKKKTLNLSQRKYLSPLIDAYIAISKTKKNTLHIRGVSKNKIFTIPSAVQVELFKRVSHVEGHNFNQIEMSKCGYDLNNQILLVGTASAFTKEKGLEHFLAAIKQLDNNKNLPKFAVLMAGDGELRKTIQQEFRSANLSTPICIMGYHQDMPTFLSGLDVFVMPSIFEGLGSVALEALAAECCVVSSDAGGLKEFIFNEETG
ncbi:MAG: glycosyltransferase, partial [Bdellovibrionales bacterium]|nr:glycosyltransferase [Bdellovibrionales bacterium]